MTNYHTTLHANPTAVFIRTLHRNPPTSTRQISLFRTSTSRLHSPSQAAHPGTPSAAARTQKFEGVQTTTRAGTTAGHRHVWRPYSHG